MPPVPVGARPGPDWPGPSGPLHGSGPAVAAPHDSHSPGDAARGRGPPLESWQQTCHLTAVW